MISVPKSVKSNNTIVLGVVVLAVLALVYFMFQKPAEGFLYGFNVYEDDKATPTDVNRYTKQFRLPNGYDIPEINKNKSNYTDERKVLLTDGNGQPIETTVKIAYPRVYGISGHENKPYFYQDFMHHCPCMADKLDIDRHAGNHFIPRMCDLCKCDKDGNKKQQNFSGWEEM